MARCKRHSKVGFVARLSNEFNRLVSQHVRQVALKTRRSSVVVQRRDVVLAKLGGRVDDEVIMSAAEEAVKESNPRFIG